MLPEAVYRDQLQVADCCLPEVPLNWAEPRSGFRLSDGMDSPGPIYEGLGVVINRCVAGVYANFHQSCS